MAEITELLGQLQKAIKLNNFCLSTEKNFMRWTERFLIYHENKQPSEMEATEIQSFLKHLEVDRKVAPSGWLCQPALRPRGAPKLRAA